jgi:hypothetical protein
MTTHQLSRQQARRIAVRAQWLHRDRPPGLLELVRQLTLLQVDLTPAVAPSADLVAWSRLGSSYSPADLESGLGDQALLELRGMIRPAEDLALYRADMAGWDQGGEVPGWHAANRDWVAVNKACRLDILHRLRTDGPLPARELPDTCEVPWRSTGWTNNRNVLRLLEFMEERGEVAVVGGGRPAGTGSGTWPNGSSPTTTWSPPPRRRGSVRGDGCGRWASPALAARDAPSSRRMSVRWASRP